MNFRFIYLCLVVTLIGEHCLATEPVSLWQHVRSADDISVRRNVIASWSQVAESRILKLSVSPSPGYASAIVAAPNGGWHLENHATVNAEIINSGSVPANLLFWVVGDRGWDAVPSQAVLEAGETRVLSCSLRETHPDGTPKIDPCIVKQIEIMFVTTARKPLKERPPETIDGKPSVSIDQPVEIELRRLSANGDANAWKRPAGRLDVPSVENAAPSAGHRVRYRLEGDQDSKIYSLLNLPEDWKPGQKYPVIVEYPGNVFFTPGCYSTGLPDQCVIGFGMNKGKGAICLGLPFVDRQADEIVESGWGNADDTCDYAIKMVDQVCTKFGGDPENLVLTGFSRGAIACGYIGLRNDRIAKLWKGIHACQHYDGDGWRGATLEGAIERGQRFQGKAVFQTDNSQEKFQRVMDAMTTEVTYVDSGLGAHATAMFLDDRPSTVQLRKWFIDLVSNRH